MQLRENNLISPAESAQSAAAVSRVREYTDSLRASGVTPRAHVMTFGCQQNEADSERMAGLCREMGYEYTDSPEFADIVLVNTCAIREHAEKKALSVIGQLKHVKAKNPSMIIGVGGCMVSQQHRADKLKSSYPYVDFSFCTTELYSIPKLVAQRIAGGRRSFPDVADSLSRTDFSEDVPVLRSSESHAWVSVMYGCNNFCSYCIVPYVRGRERSRRPADIIAEVSELAASGCHDITLLGQNVNSYGHDLDCGVDFADLLDTLAKIEGDFRLRFMTSHPKDANEKLIRVMAENEKIARHFHLPLQSGSDLILSAMNRRYTSGKYLKIVSDLRAAMPDIAITSDIIVGFPGETEEDFEQTLSVLKLARFDMIYSFIYSPRVGTPAAKMENQVPDEIKSERFSRLIELQNEISHEKNENEVGKTVRVLTDDCAGGAASTGRTGSNKLVRYSGGAKPGEFVNVSITRADTYGLFGDIT